MKINRQKKKPLLLISTIILLIIVFTGLTVKAAVPKYITFQGVLTDADGKAVTGSKSMVFAIYTAKTGGTAVLSETESVTIDSNGVYNVELDVSSLDFNEPYWLGINVEGEGDLSATAKELARKVIDRVKK